MPILDRKVAIVTGGAGGIGSLTARLMAAEGAQVVIADIDGDGATRVAAEVDGLAVQVDVSDEAGVERMIAAAVDAFGGLDILHNNAVDASIIDQDDDIATLDMAVFDRTVAVGLKAAFM